jgi:hypothetical protein
MQAHLIAQVITCVKDALYALEEKHGKNLLKCMCSLSHYVVLAKLL